MRFLSILSTIVLTLFCFSINIEAQNNEQAQKSGKEKSRPALFLIGDSTVNNSGESMMGWGNVIDQYFDKSKINVVNRARGGRSSRTFFTEGIWQQVLSEINPGDFVLMQFGHNDGGPIDKEKARGSLKGTGEETQDVTVEATGKRETVHTFGWYMRKYIEDTRPKGATAIILSPVPRNIWKDGEVVRASSDYGKWAAEVAKSEKVFFVDLNGIVAKHYEKDGALKVGAEYFTTKDHTHTSAAGARLNAASVVEGLKRLKKIGLQKYILKQPSSPNIATQTK